MRNINLLDIDYTEKDIKTLIRFNNYIRNSKGKTIYDIKHKNFIKELKKLNEFSNEEKIVIYNFIIAGGIKKEKPSLGLLIGASLIIPSCFIEYFLLRFSISSVIAFIITYNFYILVNIRTYKQIMKLIDENIK